MARPLVQLLRDGLLDRYVVVDAAPSIISSFRASLAPLPRGMEVVEAFFEQFERSERFDVIEAGFVLEHVNDPGVVLTRMRRYLAPGGRMFAAVPNARSLHRLLGQQSGLLPDLYKLSDADLSLGHQRYFDVESLTALVERCGYRIERVEGLLLKPFTTRQLGLLDLAPSVWTALQVVAARYPEISNSFFMELSACT